MAADNAPVIIIGTGLAGYNLAREFRKLDKETPLVLITADDGASYSKPMLSTGMARQKSPEGLVISNAGQMAEQLNATIRTFTTVTGIHADDHQIALAGERLTYSRLVLAWGAAVVPLALAGDAGDRIHTINSLLDYAKFRAAIGEKQRVVILGAGLIGCEFANDLHLGGHEVSIVAPSDQVLPGLLPAPAAGALREALAGLGVQFHLDTLATAVNYQENGEGVSVTLANGEQINADIVLSAVGLRPRLTLAEDAGIEVQHGILVNELLETSRTDIFALGDCAEVAGRVLMYVLPLMACARTLAKTLAGAQTAVNYNAMPIVIKTPACPVVISPVAADHPGSWRFEGEGRHLKGLFYDEQEALQGFVLTGDRVSEKQALTRLLPPMGPMPH